MKKLLSAMLVLVMLASMIVMPTYATGETEPQTQPGYCQHCKTVIPEDEWIAWVPSDTGPRTGHYYLNGDVTTQASQITINLDDDLNRNVICLDLRGRVYTVKDFRPFLIYGIFSIMDSVGGGEISVTGAVKNSSGGFCQMGQSKNSKDGPGELNLYSGTIRKVDTDTDAVAATGGLIYMSSGSTFNMYGGKVIGGRVDSRLNSSGSRIKALGGAIHATAANINLYGGVITGGMANDGYIPQADGTVKEYDAYGGNIYAEKGTYILIDGGTVENGYSETSGGNIELQASTLELRSGSILGGYSAGASGNVNIGGASTFIMSGGVIKNGVCKTTGGNLRVNNAGATLNISGGEIYGDIYAKLFKSFTLSGAPKIYMGLGNGLRLYEPGGPVKLDVAGLTQGAEIYLDGVDQVFTEVLENPETYLGYFKDAIRADISVDESGALKVEQGTTGFCPHCWQSGVQATWTQWHNKVDSEDKTKLLSETANKHYYLGGTIARTGIIGIGTSSKTAADIVFDMNGKTWTTTNKKLFNLYGQLSLIDSIGNGKLTSTGHAGANGGVIMGSSTGIFNMYSGTLSRTVADGEEMKGVLLGGILYAPAGSKTNIYGGTIRDGISASISESGNYCRGGNIYAAGSFTMTAGALIGGKAYANSYIKQDTANPALSDGKPVIRHGQGGNLYASGKATITGGHIIGGNANHGGNVYISSGATPSISGCVIRNGLADATAGLVDTSLDMSMYGGNLFVSGSSTKQQVLAIENALIRGGKAKEFGGGIYATSTDLTLRNSLIADGTAGLVSGDDGRGGNLYLSSTATVDMYDTTVGNGYALGHGGNLFAPGGVAFRMHSGLFIGGQTKGYGGNMYCNGLYMHGGLITGGVSGLNGGNIHVYEGEKNFLTIEATADGPAPIVSGGKGGSMGGNISLGKNTTATITGAIIEKGDGDTGNKSANFNADGIFANVGTTLTLTDTTILDIVSDSNYGNGVYAAGELILKGSTQVINEEQDSCIYIASDGCLTVDAGFTGEASVAFENAHFADPEEPQGDTLAEQNSATGTFTGTLLLEGYLGRDYGMPAIFAAEGDSKLYVASTAIIRGEEITWFKNAADAAAAAPEDGYLKLFGSNNAVEMDSDIVIDLNGNNLAATGTGTLYAFDTANDDYTTYGTATIAGGVKVLPAYQAPNGHQYITITEESGVSFHRLGLRVSTVSVRPSLAGIYYNGIWNCDDVLKAKIKSFGVAVSTNDMPTEASLSELDTICTAYDADEFEAGKEKTSVMISNILKAGEDNHYRGTKPIYTALYTVIDDGSEKGLVIMGDDNAYADGGVTYTLQSVLQKVDTIWPALTENQQAGIKQLYNIDSEELATWKLYNITADIKGVPSVRPLKILTLGHSLAVDSCHMVNLVAAAEGYDQPLLVATLYESGCKLSEHVEYSSTDSPKYSLYLSSTETPDKPPVILPNYTMKKALQYEDWDIIIMQGGVFEIAHEENYTNGNIQFIKEYVRQYAKNPDFIFAWHAPWVTPINNDLRDMYPYSPNSYYTNYEKYFDNDRSKFYDLTFGCVEKFVLTDPDYIYLIPSGTALENALSSYLEETDLHRDYAHATDLGRVIAAYTWYCTLAGVDHLDEIKLDAIPVAFFKSTKGTEDRVLTDMEKAIILEAVNNALKDPTHVTQSQYTVAP